MGPRTRGKGKLGSTGPGFRPEKSSDGKKFRPAKVPTGKVPTEKFRPEKFRPEKFRPGKSSDQEKVPTRKKVPTGKKFRPGRKGKMQSSEHRTRAIYSNIDKIENNSDSKGNSNRKE